MTGESVELKKDLISVCNVRKDELAAQKLKKGSEGVKSKERSRVLPSPILQSGTGVSGGEGKMVCLMVGEESCIGVILSKLVTKDEVTPLQQKLEAIGIDIGKMGTYVALLIVHVLLFRYFLEGLS